MTSGNEFKVKDNKTGKIYTAVIFENNEGVKTEEAFGYKVIRRGDTPMLNLRIPISLEDGDIILNNPTDTDSVRVLTSEALYNRYTKL